MCLFWLNYTPLMAMESMEVYVGDVRYLVAPSPPRGAINQTAWGSSGAHIQIVSREQFAIQFKVTEYFSGTEYIQCDYYYYWYVNSRMYTSHATEFYAISCKSVNISISRSQITMNVGDTYSLSASLSPNISPTPTVSWRSDDNRIASVSNYGTVYANRSGTTTIRAKSNAGSGEATCTVTVKAEPPTSIYVTPSSISLNRGSTTQLQASASPSSASSSITWSSNSANVSVSSSGYVTAKSKGTATVYAKSDLNPNVYGTCEITVTNDITGLKFQNDSLFMIIGESKKLQVIKIPSDADDAEYRWSSSNPEVATVDSDGTVRCLSTGTTDIKVEWKNNTSVFASVKIICMKPSSYQQTPVPRITNLQEEYHDGDYLYLKTELFTQEEYYIWTLDGKVVSGAVRLDSGQHVLGLKYYRNYLLSESLVKYLYVK